MQWFGNRPFGPVCEHAAKVDAPIGCACDWCEEPIVFDDEGLLIPSVGTPSVFHRVCFLRSIIGSLGHQQQKCGCYGGNEEDPPEMTKKQAAEAATEFFETNLRRNK